MDLQKSLEYLNPAKVKGKLNIVGCGSVGSTLAIILAKFGLTNFVLYDFDKVEEKNIVNQMYTQEDVGQLKVDALMKHLAEENPEIPEHSKIKPKGWVNERMSGYIFLAVDNIDLRREIVKAHIGDPGVKAIFDFRTLLESAQHFAADWSKEQDQKNLLATMDFTQEEAEAEGGDTLSACGGVLGVAPTVWQICSCGAANFINFVKGKALKKLIIYDAFNFTIQAY